MKGIMKKTFFTILILALTFPAMASEYTSRARVIESTPIVETVYEPVETCHYERRKVSKSGISNNTGNKLAGGLIGGVAGSAVGKGSGRDAAAAIGAIVGSEVADDDGITEGEIIGGIAGGLLGNQLGKGRGKTAATAAGALLGSIVGDNIQNGEKSTSTSTQSKKVRVCTESERAKKIITGYEVTYEYAGTRHIGELSREPGKYIDINVAVDVLETRRTGGAY